MPSIAKLRRTWFALVREAGICPADRHAVQERLTGKPSTRDWHAGDFEAAIAQLQRDLGQHNDHRAHVREDRPGGVATEEGTWATDAQASYITDLCDRVDWHAGRDDGPVRYVCAYPLRGDDKALRREQIRRAHDQGERGPALWTHLTREEASGIIKALQRLAHHNPKEQT
ncbi:MAG: hypothetical protein ACODAJ_05560 [Planctomycetota bacterium]